MKCLMIGKYKMVENTLSKLSNDFFFVGVVIDSIPFFFLLECSFFTKFYYFLLYNEVNQLYVYLY